MVSYTDFPAGAAKAETSGKLFDGVRDGLKGRTARSSTRSDVGVGTDKLPGREIEIEKEKQRMKFRVVLRDDRLYQVAVDRHAEVRQGQGRHRVPRVVRIDQVISQHTEVFSCDPCSPRPLFACAARRLPRRKGPRSTNRRRESTRSSSPASRRSPRRRPAVHDLNIAMVVKGAGGFGVIYTDLPPETTKRCQAERPARRRPEKGLVENFKAKLTSSKDFEFGRAKVSRSRTCRRRRTSSISAFRSSWPATGCTKCSWWAKGPDAGKDAEDVFQVVRDHEVIVEERTRPTGAVSRPIR